MYSRVVHLDSGQDWRGGQRQLYFLALEQRSRGMEPLVLGQPRTRLVTRLRRAGVASAGVRMRGVWDLAAIRRIRRQIRGWRAGIVHVHDARALSLAHAAIAGMPHVRLIVTCRTVPLRHRALERASYRVARFTAPNAQVSDFLTEIGIPRKTIDLIPPAVPEPRDVRARNWRSECRWPADATVCGVIGLSGGGGLARLRSVLGHLAKDERAASRIVLLGDVPPGELKLAGTEAFGAGFVDDIAAAIAGFDLLCSLSGKESMGTAVLDAMALGIPSITFQSAGAAEYIENEKSGLIVASDDPVAFAKALSSLICDRELRASLAAKGPARAGHFTPSRLADGVGATYAKAGSSPSLPAERTRNG